MIGHGLRAGKFRRPGRGIEESPMTADRPLESTFPRLIEGFDDVHVEIPALAECKHVLDDARLVCRRRERPFAHAACTGPANLADQYLLAGKCVDHLTA